MASMGPKNGKFDEFLPAPR